MNSQMPIYTYDENGYYVDQMGNRFLRDSDTGQYYPQGGGGEFARGGSVRRYAFGGPVQINPNSQPGALSFASSQIAGTGQNANAPAPSNMAPAKRIPQNKLNPKAPLPRTNPMSPPTTGGPLQNYNQQQNSGYGNDMRYTPQTGGGIPLPEPQTGGDLPLPNPQTGGNLPLPNQQPMFGGNDLSTQMPTQQFVGGMGGQQPSPYSVNYSPQQQPIAPAAYAAGGPVKMSRGGGGKFGSDPMEEEGALLTLADIYGLSNPGDLPMVEAPVRMAAVPTVQTDAEGFPVGSTADIVAAGRAAVAQAQANSRAGIQPDPAVYDDTAAAREGTAVSTPRSAPAVSRPSIDELLKKYGASSGSQYAEQIRAAAEKSRAETDAFREMLKKQITGESEGGPSKAEMYFRLAAALAAPTRTGGVMENVGLAAKELGDYQKDVTASRKANRARNLELMLKGQELGMRSAKDELDTLRALDAEEGRDRRQVVGEAIKEYIRSGEPQSAAAKQAKDEGLTPGTPEFIARVKEIAQTSVDAKMAQITATLADMQGRASAAELAQRKFEEQVRAAAEKEKKLTPREFDLMRETEDSIRMVDEAKRDLMAAYQASELAFERSLMERGERLALSQTMSSDPRVVASETMEQKLRSQTIATAAEKMKGVLSDSDIKLLQSIQGLDASSRKAREKIIMDAYEALMRGQEFYSKRLNDINARKYLERGEPKPEGQQ
jgi:hypothetical protein